MVWTLIAKQKIIDTFTHHLRRDARFGTTNKQIDTDVEIDGIVLDVFCLLWSTLEQQEPD